AAPHAAHDAFDAHEGIEIVVRYADALAGEAGGDERVAEFARLADVTGRAVALRAAGTERQPARAERRRDHGARDRHAARERADAHAEVRMTVHEVGRAVARVDLPADVARGLSSFFLRYDRHLRSEL